MTPNTSINFVKSPNGDLICTLSGDEQLNTFLSTSPSAGIKIECNFTFLDHVYPIQEERVNGLKEILNKHGILYSVEEHLSKGCCIVEVT